MSIKATRKAHPEYFGEVEFNIQASIDSWVARKKASAGHHLLYFPKWSHRGAAERVSQASIQIPPRMANNPVVPDDRRGVGKPGCTEASVRQKQVHMALASF